MVSVLFSQLSSKNLFSSLDLYNFSKKKTTKLLFILKQFLLVLLHLKCFWTGECGTSIEIQLHQIEYRSSYDGFDFSLFSLELHKTHKDILFLWSRN